MGRKSDLMENIQELLNKRLRTFLKDTKGNYYEINPTRLLHYVEKNFSLKSERELKLLTLFLVTSFWGLGINHLKKMWQTITRNLHKKGEE